VAVLSNSSDASRRRACSFAVQHQAAATHPQSQVPAAAAVVSSFHRCWVQVLGEVCVLPDITACSAAACTIPLLLTSISCLYCCCCIIVSQVLREVGALPDVITFLCCSPLFVCPCCCCCCCITVSQVLGEVGALPDVYSELEVNFFLLRRLLGVRSKEGEKAGKVRPRVHNRACCYIVLCASGIWDLAVCVFVSSLCWGTPVAK
jgi:hypothetical protein